MSYDMYVLTALSIRCLRSSDSHLRYLQNVSSYRHMSISGNLTRPLSLRKVLMCCRALAYVGHSSMKWDMLSTLPQWQRASALWCLRWRFSFSYGLPLLILNIKAISWLRCELVVMYSGSSGTGMILVWSFQKVRVVSIVLSLLC